MTLAISWLHDGGDTVETGLHQAGDWQRNRRKYAGLSAFMNAELNAAGQRERVQWASSPIPSKITGR
jgi:hypothetical protein